MFKNKVLFRILGILFSITSLSHAENFRHNPNHIFKDHPSGVPSLNITHITGADTLHSKGLTGRGIKVAVIDGSFHPSQIKPYEDKGVLHPGSIKKKLILTSSETYPKSVKKKHDKLHQQLATEYREHKLPILYKKLAPLCMLKRRKTQLKFIEKGKSSNHGAGVLKTLHVIAPEAQLLPIDIALFTPGIISKAHLKHFSAALETSIINDVDAINLCVLPAPEYHPTLIEFLKKAVQKGIPIFLPAGNASTQEKALFISQDSIIKDLPPRKRILKALGTNNVYFAGACAYKQNGEEVYAPFSQHPTSSMLSHHLLTPGIAIPCPFFNNADQLGSGTSLSAPILTGGYCIIKQFAKGHGLAHTPEDIFKIMHESGRNVSHRVPGTPHRIYKSLDLENALRIAKTTLRNNVSPPPQRTPVVPTPQPNLGKKGKQAVASEKRAAKKQAKATRKTKKRKMR